MRSLRQKTRSQVLSMFPRVQRYARSCCDHEASKRRRVPVDRSVFSKRCQRSFSWTSISGSLYKYSCVEPDSGGRHTMRNHFKTFILLGTLSAIFIAVGGMLGNAYLILFAVLALGFNFAAYWFSDRIVLALHQVREIAPQD